MSNLINPIKCTKCGELYGQTNLHYKDVQLWQTCKCYEDDKIRLVDFNNVVVKEPEPTELEKAANEYGAEHYNENVNCEIAFEAGARWLADKIKGYEFRIGIASNSTIQYLDSDFQSRLHKILEGLTKPNEGK